MASTSAAPTHSPLNPLSVIWPLYWRFVLLGAFFGGICGVLTGIITAVLISLNVFPAAYGPDSVVQLALGGIIIVAFFGALFGGVYGVYVGFLMAVVLGALFAVSTPFLIPAIIANNSERTGWLFRLYGAAYGLSASLLTLYMADLLLPADSSTFMSVTALLPNGSLQNNPTAILAWAFCALSFASVGFILTTWLLAKHNATYHTIRIFNFRLPY